MRPPFINPTFILLILACVKIERTLTVSRFTLTSCSNSNLKASRVQVSQRRSLLACAFGCNNNPQCHHAMFRDSSKQCLYLSSEGTHSISEDPSYTPETGCVVLQGDISNMKCQNGGMGNIYTCQCPVNFRGRECKDLNPEFCQSGLWKQISDPKDYPKVPVKLQINHDFGVTIYPMTHCTKNRLVIVHNFLSVNTTTKRLKIPISREFSYHQFGSESLETVSVTMTGDSTDTNTTGFVASFWAREQQDSDIPIYDFYKTGSTTKLIDGLSKGFQLMQREFTMVAFDKEKGDVFFNTIKQKVVGFYYFSMKTIVRTRKRFVSKINIKTGSFVRSYNVNVVSATYLDRCWISLGLDYVDLTSALKEYVLRGRDVRLVLHGLLSTDVAMVTITHSDVIVATADLLSPFDQESNLDQNTRINFLLLGGISKIRTECVMAFLGKDVFSKTDKPFPYNLEWFVQSRQSTKHLSVKSNGERTGSLLALYNAVLDKRDIRVCVEMTNGQTMCSGTTVVHAGNDGHVTVQTPTVLRPRTDAQGKLAGTPNCKRIVRNISTKGWIEEVAYILQMEVSTDDVTNLDFVEMIWFVI